MRRRPEVRKRKIHAGTISHRLTACGLSRHRRYVAHPTSGAEVNCQECLKALVDRRSHEDFQNYLAGGRVAIPTSEVT